MTATRIWVSGLIFNFPYRHVHQGQSPPGVEEENETQEGERNTCVGTASLPSNDA